MADHETSSYSRLRIKFLIPTKQVLFYYILLKNHFQEGKIKTCKQIYNEHMLKF